MPFTEGQSVDPIQRIRRLAHKLAFVRILTKSDADEIASYLRRLADHQEGTRKGKAREALAVIAEERDTIIAMRRAGIKLYQIAESMGLSRASVWRVLNEAGLVE